MRVLVTRPENDARATAMRLSSLGHVPIVAPLIATHYFVGSELALEGVQALIATSANGVRSLARRTSERSLPLFAVGPQTASSARSLGFENVTSADGDSRALANLVTASLAPGAGALIHAAGHSTQGMLAESLRENGFEVRREELYETQSVTALPAAAATELRQETLDAVLLYSPRSARIFRDFTTEAGFASACVRLLAVCISTAAADSLSPLKFREIRAARAPNQEALLACLG